MARRRREADDEEEDAFASAGEDSEVSAEEDQECQKTTGSKGQGSKEAIAQEFEIHSNGTTPRGESTEEAKTNTDTNTSSVAWASGWGPGTTRVEQSREESRTSAAATEEKAPQGQEEKPYEELVPQTKVPRHIRYFAHDTREGDEKEGADEEDGAATDEKAEAGPEKSGGKGRSKGNKESDEKGADAPGKWGHDKFHELYGANADAPAKSASRSGRKQRYEEASSWSSASKSRAQDEWGSSAWDAPSSWEKSAKQATKKSWDTKVSDSAWYPDDTWGYEESWEGAAGKRRVAASDRWTEGSTWNGRAEAQEWSSWEGVDASISRASSQRNNGYSRKSTDWAPSVDIKAESKEWPSPSQDRRRAGPARYTEMSF